MMKKAEEFVKMIQCSGRRCQSFSSSSSCSHTNHYHEDHNSSSSSSGCGGGRSSSSTSSCSGNGVVVLEDIIRFRRRTRSHPTTFEDFLQALKTNTTNTTTTTTGNAQAQRQEQQQQIITKLICHGQLSFGLTQDEWTRTIGTFGEMPYLQDLIFRGEKAPNVIPLAALARALQRRQEIQQRQQQQQQQQLQQNQKQIQEQPLTCTDKNNNNQSFVFRSLTIGEGVILNGTTVEYQHFCQSLAALSSLESFVWEGRLRLSNALSSLDLLCTHGLARCPNLVSACLRTEATLPTSAQALERLLRQCASPHLSQLEVKSAQWGSIGPTTLLSSNDDDNDAVETNHHDNHVTNNTTTCRPCPSFSSLTKLRLTTYLADEEQCESLLSTLCQNSCLQELYLTVGAGFSDSMALAIYQALKEQDDDDDDFDHGNDKEHPQGAIRPRRSNLGRLVLSDATDYLPRLSCLTERGFGALLQLLCSNSSLQLDLSHLSHQGVTNVDTRTRIHRTFAMENCLNRARHRPLLLSTKTTPTFHDWLDVYQNLLLLSSSSSSSSSNYSGNGGDARPQQEQDDENDDDDAVGMMDDVDDDMVLGDCIYEIVRTNPSIWLMS